MATEEFKQLTEELFKNYALLHSKIAKEGHQVKLSFKEYLDFYIEYSKDNLNLDGFNEEEEDDDDELDSEEDSK